MVAFIGRIDLLSVSRIQRTLSIELSQQPYALICDLSGVTHLDPRCASDWLHIAVHDGSPRLLRLVTPNPKADPEADPEAEGGRGLRLVEQLARAWGANRHPDGGKSSGAPSSSTAHDLDPGRPPRR